MLLYNFAEPDWIQVDCYAKLTMAVLCMYTEPHQLKKEEYNKYVPSGTRLVCSNTTILYDKHCLLFLWFTGTQLELFQNCKDSNAEPFVLKTIDNFKYMFDAISSQFPPIVSLDSNNSFTKFTYKRYGNLYHYLRETVVKEVEGLQVCSSAVQMFSAHDNLYLCNDNSYVASLLICDKSLKCPNSKNKQLPIQCQMLSGEKFKPRNCGKLLYMSIHNQCIPYVSQDDTLLLQGNKNDKLSFQKYIEFETIKSRIIINDLVADFGPNGKDEPELSTLLTENNYLICKLPFQIPCIEGHSRCYNISQICSYKLIDDKYLIPCRTGNHLQYCKHFQCNAMYKCTDSYCIPWTYINDGKWDCPDGEDEHIKFKCDGMFKCRSKNEICIHLRDVCDGKFNCPYNDDELLCSLAHVKCPLYCSCFGLAIHCQNQVVALELTNSYPYNYVHFCQIHNFQLKLIKNVFPDAKFGIYLSNNIYHICDILLPKHMAYIDISLNKISFITRSCFKQSAQLKVILLNNNMISHIQQFAFIPLLYLYILNLSNNPMIEIMGLLMPKLHIKTLYLRNIMSYSIDTNAFMDAQIEIIYATEYHLCCLAPASIKCMAEKKWYINCNYAIPKEWFVILGLIIGSNIFYFTFYILARKTHVKTFLLMIFSLLCNNTFAALYIGIIVYEYSISENKFYIRNETFRSNYVCFVAFNSILIYSFVNVSLQVLVSTSRLMVVLFPVNTKFKRFGFVLKCLFFIFLNISVSCFILSFLIKNTYFYITTHIMFSIH